MSLEKWYLQATVLFKKHRWLTLALAIVVILLAVFVGYQAVVLLLSLALTYLLLEHLLSKTVFNTGFYRAVVAVVAYYALLQATILAAWLFDNNFPLSFSIVLTFLLLVIAHIWNYFIYSKQSFTVDKTSYRRFSFVDLIAVALGALIVFLVLAGPLVKSIHYYGRINVGAVAEDYVNTSLDDSNHLSRINDRLELNRGVLYKSNQVAYVVHGDSISTYPPGWHSANAAVIKALDPGIKVGGQSLLAYIATKIFWLFILVYCFTRVVGGLISTFMEDSKGKARLLARFVYFALVVGFLAYYSLLEQFQEGFYTFIPVLISLFLATALLLQFNIDKSPGSKSSKYRTLLPLVLVTTNLTLSWFLIMPAVVLAVVVAFAFSGKSGNFKGLVLKVWSELVRRLPLVLLAVLAVLAQIIVITAPGSQSFKVGVNTPGAITMHSVAYFGFTILGIFLFYALLNQKQHLTEGITILLVCLLGFAMFIYLFQVATLHQPQYYYYKTLYAAMAVALPIGVTGWLLLFERVARSYSGLVAVFFAFGLAMCVPLIIGIEPVNDALLTYVHGTRPFTIDEDAYIYNSISERSQLPIAQRTADVIFYTPGQIGQNIVGTNILRSMQHINGCDDRTFTQLLNDNQSGLFSTLKGCQSSPLTIVTQPPSYALLKSLVTVYGLNGTVSVVPLR